MNDLVQTEEPERQTRLQVFMGQVLPPSKRAEIAAALPAHIPFARFERNSLFRQAHLADESAVERTEIANH